MDATTFNTHFESSTKVDLTTSFTDSECWDPAIGRKNTTILIFYVIFFILGVFGNCMLVLLYLLKKNLRTVNNAFITNLALSDFLFVLLFVPIKIHEEIYYGRPFGKTFCFISIITNYASQDVSTLSMTVLAYLRYRAVMRPLRIRQDDENQQKWVIPVCCTITWCVAITAAVLPALHCEVWSDKCLPWEMHYVSSFGENLEGFKIFHSLRFVFLYFVPLAIIAIFYSIMACKLCREPSFLNKTDSASNMRAARSRKKLGGVLLAIVLIFFISWLPNYITWFLLFTKKTLIDHPLAAKFRVTCMFLPATLNPILLFMTSSGYRQPLLGLCPPWHQKGRGFVHRLRSSTLSASLASIRLSRLSRFSKQSSSSLPTPT